MTDATPPLRQIVFDTETTGMNQGVGPHYLGHRVIEIGCVEMINRKLTGRTYHVFIRPDRPVDEEAIQVHGITDEFLLDKPEFAQIADEFFDFICGAELIAHNATFDIGFLDYEFEMLGRFGKVTDHCSVIDTLKVAREKKNRGEIQGNLNLDALCRFYGIDNSHRTLHGALLDSEILADVYLYMTGGQTKLQFNSGNSDGGEAIRRLPAERATTRVIRACTEELESHKERMAAVSDAIWYRSS
ncbi:DNA polymerase III subunit epsilon [Ferrimonas gelatinilytica]|uniref:DNA polymerase III subunit epsilon n=1 Tax=Ferrimonas gelatinilytica TaxID=1255257 RepID=A0ABP9RZM1_9GAMM